MSFGDHRIKAMKVTSERLTVELFDGRRVSLPLSLFPTLAEAAPAERAKWDLCGAGTGVHWPLLDYDLSAEGLLRREPEAVDIQRAKKAASYPPHKPGKAGVLAEEAAHSAVQPGATGGRPSGNAKKP
jgi:hypothetical protein